MALSLRDFFGIRASVFAAAAACALVTAALLAGCQADSPAAAAPANAATATPPTMETDMQSTTPPAGSALDAQLRKGMAYGDFRKAVLAAGWEPLPNAACRANLLGDAAEQTCAADPQLIQCRICEEMPELDSCSSDALCLVRFRHLQDSRVLRATGRGEVRYWQDTGDDAGLQIVGWEYKGAR